MQLIFIFLQLKKYLKLKKKMVELKSKNLVIVFFLQFFLQTCLVLALWYRHILERRFYCTATLRQEISAFSLRYLAFFLTSRIS